MAGSKGVVTEIKKATGRRSSPDEEIRPVLEGLRNESSMSEICSGEGVAASLYSKRSMGLLEAGGNGMTRGALRDAATDEIKRLRQENGQGRSPLSFRLQTESVGQHMFPEPVKRPTICG
jgi:transposase